MSRSSRPALPSFAAIFGGGKLTYILLAILFAFLLIIYSQFDPSQSRLAPKCLFHLLTGLDCPGCGAQRMAYALMHADLRAAWNANAFLMLSIPLLVLGVWADLRPGPVRRFVYARLTIPIYIITMILWTIGRNIFD